MIILAVRLTLATDISLASSSFRHDPPRSHPRGEVFVTDSVDRESLGDNVSFIVDTHISNNGGISTLCTVLTTFIDDINDNIPQYS
ncbi:hypothetical protein AB6A40_004598 [Gnathostoma spinigerum]|uniref:Cadherin domain-containing protein n=1 Tax=Gnathostoma spinigerum TaxID=75299 RepID=A0ABD6EIA2_9BILA